MVLFIMLYKVILISESVDEILKCGLFSLFSLFSSTSLCTVHRHDTVQGGSHLIAVEQYLSGTV